MTLTQQFVIITILPLSFLVMAAYTWRVPNPRRQVVIRWLATLGAAAVWASHILRFYGGRTFPDALVYTWGIVGSYAFGLAALGLLLTTIRHLSVPREPGRIAVALGVILWLAAFALDPGVWRYQVSDLSLVGQPIELFDIWGGVWIASWLIPVISAWVLTQQQRSRTPTSLYRNQIHYWLFVQALFFVGGLLASIRQPGQPVWPELGLLFILLAAYAGSVSIASSQLTDLGLAIRQILGRLSGTLILFGLTWAALYFIVQAVTDLPTATNPNLLLLLAAAIFAGLFTLTYRSVNHWISRLFMPAPTDRERVMADYTSAVGTLPEPAELSELVLGVIHDSVAVDEAWFFAADDGVEGALELRPLAYLGEPPPELVQLGDDSPFAGHMRQQTRPLIQYDIDALADFDHMAAEERDWLTAWQRLLYVPVHAGERLVGMIALGAKYSGEPYDHEDLEMLETLSAQVGPQMAQAQNLSSLRQINDYLFQQNQELSRENQQLTQLTQLHDQVIGLISPELRRPFAAIDDQLYELQDNLKDGLKQAQVSDLSLEINRLKTSIERLVTMSARLQKHGSFRMRPVFLDEVTHQAVRALQRMAEGRQVRVSYSPGASLPPVLADEGRLKEAVQYVLHNAIKYNKIGGKIEIEHEVADGDVCLHIHDLGIGIPAEKLETIWDGPQSVSNAENTGSGLGLAMTRYIVSAHGGRVEAHSKAGSGSTFSIHLPILIEV